MSLTDPREIINESPMSARQWIIVAIMVLLNATDGFDVLASAFAAPGISAEWGIPRSELGIVLSAELVGMGFGSVILGGMADRLGRKPAMILCLLIAGFGMLLAANASGLVILSTWRFITGLGIGGMLAAINAVTAECTNSKERSLAMALMVIGYPLGAVGGGLVAAELLEVYTWRSMFIFGSIVSFACLPLVLLLVPEMPAYYVATRRRGALEKINKSLVTLGLKTISALPPETPAADKPKISDILRKPALRTVTLLLAFGYMCHTITFYYILKWSPQIVADFGYAPSQAATVLVWANIGGALGGFVFGFLMRKWDIKGPTIMMLLLAAAAVAAFGFAKETLWGWRMATFLTGFATNAAIVGFYAAFARGFPAHARATGTGIVLGIGRLGAAGSPILAGFLFVAMGNDKLLEVSVIMALGSIAAAVLLFILPLKDGDEVMAGKA